MASITFDELEARALEARVGAIRARRAMRRDNGLSLRSLAALPLAPVIIPLGLYQLRSLLRKITVIDPELLGVDDAEKLADVLRHLHGDLRELLTMLDSVQETAVGRVANRLFSGYREAAERLGDLLESYELSRDEEFRAFVAESVGQLKGGQDRPTDWRSSLASLQN